METHSYWRCRRLAGLLLVLLLLVGGCGKRGPLYLPPDASQPPPPAKQP